MLFVFFVVPNVLLLRGNVIMMSRITVVFAAIVLLVLGNAVPSQALTYTLVEHVANDSCGGCDVGVVGGTITTDGTIGNLSRDNILSVDPIMVKSKSGNHRDQSSDPVQVTLNGEYRQDNAGLTATLTELFLAKDDAFKAFGAGSESDRDLIEWINQEGGGDPGRRLQVRYDGQFGQHRRSATSGNLLVGTRVPEPGTAVLLMLGLCTLGAIARRSK